MRGIRDAAALESCVAQPKTAVFGYEPFPTVFDKAAAYCFYLVILHPFLDGNKRTGHHAARAFLLDHGYAPIFEENEFDEMIVRVAKGEAEIEELSSLFRRRCGLSRNELE